MTAATTGRSRRRIGAAAFAAAALCCLFSVEPDVDAKVDPRTYDIKKKILGRTAAEWTIYWNQWVFSIPEAVHPLDDTTGAHVEVGQRGPMWFLGNTFRGTKTTYAVTIPTGISLCVPIINVEWDELDPTAQTFEVMQQRAAEYVSRADVSTFHVVLDGIEIGALDRQRIQAGPLDYAIPENSVYDGYGFPQPRGIFNPGAADGYYVFLKPLEPGPHTLHVEGTHPDYRADFTFELTVVDHTLPTADPFVPLVKVKQPKSTGKRKLDPRTYDIRKKVLGKSVAEWTAEWWQWSYSIPTQVHPLVDKTGRFVEVGQWGPVWFLGGVIGSGAADRTATIPMGRSLLVPLVNFQWDAFDPTATTPELMLQKVGEAMAHVDLSSLVCIVDGTPIEGLAGNRVVSPFFGYHIPADNSYSEYGLTIPRGIVSPGISDGYWVFLKPLVPGPHTIHCEAVITGDFAAVQRYDYHLNVVEETPR